MRNHAIMKKNRKCRLMNQLGLLLFITIIPVILILIYVYQKDKKKEPISLLMQFFGLGIICCFLVIFLSQFLGNFFPFMNSENRKTFFDIFIYSFFGVAFIEEGCKWIMLYTRGYFTKEFDEIYDILVYSVFVSLGFAFFENAYYIFQVGQLKTAIIRAFSAIPGHACDAIFMGYYLSIAKQYYYKKEQKKEITNIILSIMIPTLLHGIYDFCIMSKMKWFAYSFFAFIIFLYIISIKKIKEMSEENRMIKYHDIFCKNCGAKMEGKRCKNCGTEYK